MHSGINFALIVGLFWLSSVNSEAVPQELVGEVGLNKVRETYAKAMVMFYAPWCPHCQEAKPKYNEAMGKLTDKTSTMAYVNCDNAQNSALCTNEKIEGYPTIKVYQKGKDPVNFEADFTADSFISFLKNPVANAPGPQSKEPPVADPPMTDVTYIKGAVDFKIKLSKVPHALVFFYAPWCPHCQEAKPKYSKAATALKADKERGLFAVNCDQPENTAFCTSEKVEGFPTVRYYFKGEMFQEVEEELETDPLLNVIRNPPKTKVPPTPVEEEKPGAKPDGTPAATPPPPEAKDGEKPLTDADRQPEKPQDLMKGITYLTGATAKDIMTKNPDTLVKFYAPWCPHCMEAKPIYQAANDQLKKAGSKALLAAINCDSKENEKWCEDEKVDGFPTLAYYHKGKKVKVYEESPPTTAGIVKFVSNLPRPKEEL